MNEKDASVRRRNA